MLFTCISLNPLSRFDSDNQADRLRIKRRERPYPVMPIQMTKQYAEMSVVRKQHGYILVFGIPVYEDLKHPGCRVFRGTREGLRP